MGSKRQQKFSRMLQKELANIFQLHGVSWYANNIVSVTEVEVSPDLSFAKVYLSFLMPERKEEAYDNINKHKSEIRKHLGNQIGKVVRKVPELAFYLDNSAEHADKMEQIFKKLNIPPGNTDKQN